VTEQPILVVDDDPTILATVSEALDLEGFRSGSMNSLLSAEQLRRAG